jgi:hypothetical protein
MRSVAGLPGGVLIEAKGFLEGAKWEMAHIV